MTALDHPSFDTEIVPVSPLGFTSSQIRAQDSEAWTKMYQQYDSILRTHARKLVFGDPDRADDYVSDAWLKAYEAAPRLTPEREHRLLGWLYRIVTNCVIDDQRHRAVLKMRSMEEYTRHQMARFSGDDYRNTNVLPALIDPETPETIMLREEAIIEAARLVAEYEVTLPDGVLAVVRRCMELGENQTDAAKALGFSPKSIKSRLNRFRRKNGVSMMVNRRSSCPEEYDARHVKIITLILRGKSHRYAARAVGLGDHGLMQHIRKAQQDGDLPHTECRPPVIRPPELEPLWQRVATWRTKAAKGNRRRRGNSLTGLADAAGISRGTLMGAFAGTRPTNAAMVAQITATLDRLESQSDRIAP